jgi:hypothetical protein
MTQRAPSPLFFWEHFGHIDPVWRRIITALAVVLIAGLIAGLIVSRWASLTLPPPLLLPMSLAKSNATFAVYPGPSGAMFILPDGSLWRWGAGVNHPDRLPALFDDQHHWAKAFSRGDQWMAQDANGNAWEVWGGRSKLQPLPGTNQDWIAFTGGFAYTLGLQRDGTILGWDSNFGGAGTTNMIVEVETNFLWRAISADGPSCIGVSSDGRLWTWQRNGFSPLTFSQPTQESTNTNWLGVAEGQYAWSSSGELWGTTVARLDSSNAINGRFAVGSVVHEIRADGTLWAIGVSGPRRPMFRPLMRRGSSSFSVSGYRSAPMGNGLTTNSGNLQWRRIGERSDWVSIWGSDETYFGLTSDGTVWVWGTDWGQKPIETLKDKLADLWEEIRDRFQPAAGGAGPLAGRAAVMAGRPAVTVTQPSLDEPRPLMRFKPTSK